jgi:hypothetical protein
MEKLWLYIIIVVGLSGYLVLGKTALEVSEGKQDNTTATVVIAGG